MKVEDFKARVRAKEKGFYGGQLRYPAGDDDLVPGDPRGGAEFVIGPDALRLDPDGKVFVDGDNKPVLPRWVEPLDSVEAFDKSVPTIVIENKKLQEYYKPRPKGGPAPAGGKTVTTGVQTKGASPKGGPAPAGGKGRPSDEAKL